MKKEEMKSELQQQKSVRQNNNNFGKKKQVKKATIMLCRQRLSQFPKSMNSLALKLNNVHRSVPRIYTYEVYTLLHPARDIM